MIQKIKETISEFILSVLEIPIRINYFKLINSGLLEVGRYTYGKPIIDVYKNSERKVTIGSFCSISKNVRIITGGIHPTNWVSTYPIRDFIGVDIPYDGMPTSNGEVFIGHDVWIGTGVTILSGVSIGTGAIISACTVVTKDVPPYAIVAGVPNKVLRLRFSEDKINHLLKIKWWEWDIEKIKMNIHLLNSKNIDEFINTFKID